MKIVVCEFNQESNSFNPDVTGRDAFEYYGICLEEEMLVKLKDKPRAVAGMFDAIEGNGATVIPACSMYSQSGGRIDHAVLEWFLEKTLSTIRQQGTVDGVLVSLHGATQTTACDDACGLILEKIRAEVGEQAVISASADLHANVTRKMMGNADFICGFHTYPHTDYYETGVRAARLAMARLAGKRKLHLVRVGIPMIVPANGYSTLEGPFANLVKFGQSLVLSGQLVDFSIFMMQPWLDVAEGASTIVTVAEDKKTAEKHAVEMAQLLVSLRDAFQPEMYSIDEVIELAGKDDTPKPVILVDCADSSNAGAAGDSVAVVARVLATGSDVRTASVLTDAPAAVQAHTLGVGQRAVFSLGGTRDPVHNQPIRVEATVKSLHDGIFTQEGPAGRGIVINVGLTAVLTIRGAIDIVVCHKLSGNGDPQLYRAFGLEPKLYDLVVVKACSSFKAAYQLFAGVIFPTNTPGPAAADLQSLNYKKLPKYFYPFSRLDDYQITDIIYGRT
jgi:microcystin degradation protein MlrC